MLKIARRRIVLAEGVKVGRIELAHLCPIEEIDMLITGQSADPEVAGGAPGAWVRGSGRPVRDEAERKADGEAVERWREAMS